jgi:hypothetical protein
VSRRIKGYWREGGLDLLARRRVRKFWRERGLYVIDEKEAKCYWQRRRAGDFWREGWLAGNGEKVG